jgi:hypothetical protein
MMARVQNKPRCQRCREFRPTVPVRVSYGIIQVCSACQLQVAWAGEHMPKIEAVACDLCGGSGEDRVTTGLCQQCGGKGVRSLARPT